MIRIVAFLLVVLALAAGLHWLADRPGTIVVEWQGYVAETSVFRAFVILVLAMGIAHAWRGRLCAGCGRARRRSAASSTGGGRSAGSTRSPAASSPSAPATARSPSATPARRARRCRNEPLTHLLRAQTAQLTGDRATARRIFEAMLASPDTEQLGLRGLFLEASARASGRPRASSPSARSSSTPSSAGRSRRCSICSAGPRTGRARCDTLAIGAAQQPDRQDGGQPPARRAAHRPGAGRGGYGRRQGPRAGAARRIGWRPTWCRPRPSPAASWPRRATRRAPRACCSRPGGSRRIPTSPRPMPTPGRATARATGSTACATWRA